MKQNKSVCIALYHDRKVHVFRRTSDLWLETDLTHRSTMMSGLTALRYIMLKKKQQQQLITLVRVTECSLKHACICDVNKALCSNE